MNRSAIKAMVLTGGALAACHAKDVQRSLDPKTVSACMDAQHSHDDYLLVTKCEPLGPQERFQGTWFTGLEMDAFAKGYSKTPADLGTALRDHMKSSCRLR
jgi:hypothetical protein